MGICRELYQLIVFNFTYQDIILISFLKSKAVNTWKTIKHETILAYGCYRGI